ncbi:MAG: hypothetical protein ACE5D3_04885 [Candidatus Binatia bacterium]
MPSDESYDTRPLSTGGAKAFQRVALLLVLVLPTAMVALPATGAAAITLAKAKLASGLIQVTGRGAPPLAIVFWEGEVVGITRANGAFAFATTTMPGVTETECTGRGRLVIANELVEVLVKLCTGQRGRRGRRGVAGPVGPTGPQGPPGPQASPLHSCREVHNRREVGVSAERSESVRASCEATELLTGGGCSSAPAFDSRESSRPAGQDWLCTVTATHGPELLPYGSIEAWAICCE